MAEFLDNALLGKAILSLGEADFAHTLLEALEPCVPVDHLAVVVFDDELTPHLAGAGSRQPGNVALEAGQLYERARFYQHDPGAQQIGGAGESGEGPVLARLRASDITNPRYRTEIYDRFRLLERLSIVDRVRHRWVMLNLYRGRGSEPFRDRDITRIRDVALLLVGLAGKHAALAMPPMTARRDRLASIRYLDSLLAQIEGRLTARERAVCARALAGQTVQGIASELDVRPPTVATLRRRAYAKLNISSLNELFARCMEQLARDTLVRK